jgi:hypothetical protein
MTASHLPPNFWLPDSAAIATRFSDAEIAAVESDYGIRLPALLVEIWRTMLGHGKARKRYIEWEPHEEVHKHYRGRIGIRFHTDAASCCDATGVVFDTFCEQDLIKPPGLLSFLGEKLGLMPRVRFAGLFAIGDDEYGHDTLCLDYRRSGKTGPPSITLSHYHCPSQHVSDSLEAFVARLRRYETDDCYCLTWDGDRDSLWQLIFAGFGLDPHPKGFAHSGYHPQWKKRSTGSRVYFHLAPNFDDIEEPFIEEPAERWILRVDPTHRPAVQQTLDQLGVTWKLVLAVPSK